MSILQATTYTPADLLAMPDSNNVELVHGELVEKPVSVLSSIVENRLSWRLGSHCEAHRIGIVMLATNGIQCFPDEPLKFASPTFLLSSKSDFRWSTYARASWSIVPDLAVEVISSYDEASELNEKIEEYLAAGIALVWVIDPVNQIIHIHRKDGSVTKLRKGGELSGEDVVPGFTCKVAELFPAQ